MDKSWKSGAVGTPPPTPGSFSDGYPTSGDPGLGVPATRPGPWWFHMITTELLGVVGDSGVTPDATILTQVRDALRAKYASFVALALNTGAGLIGWVQSGAGAVLMTILDKLRQRINVDDFGALADGSDDTAAFNLAKARATIGTLPCKIVTTPGKTYVLKDWQIDAPALNNNSRGEFSLVFDSRGSVLKGHATATFVLQVGAAGAGTTWANGVRAYIGDVDMSAMADTAAQIGVQVTNAYNGMLFGPTVTGEESNKIGLKFTARAYTWQVFNPSCLRVRVVGTSISTDAVTTVSITNPDVGQIYWEAASSCNVYGGAVQNATASKNIFKNCFNINYWGVDTEGVSGVAFDFSAGGCSYIRARGGNITSGLTKASGEGTGCFIEGRGSYGRTEGSESPVSSNSTNPNVLWTFQGDPTQAGKPAGFGVFIVAGDNGADGFQDMVSVAFGFVHTEFSRTKYGAPATRTYTLNNTDFRVTMGSATVININTINLWNPR